MQCGRDGVWLQRVYSSRLQQVLVICVLYDDVMFHQPAMRFFSCLRLHVTLCAANAMQCRLRLGLG